MTGAYLRQRGLVVQVLHQGGQDEEALVVVRLGGNQLLEDAQHRLRAATGRWGGVGWAWGRTGK